MNSLVITELNKQASKTARSLQPYVPPRKKLEWWRYLLNALLDVVSVVAEVVATAFLGPVGGMLVGVAADITTNIVGDLVLEQNPWEPNNIIFNIILPVVTVPGKINSISKIGKNAVNVASDIAQDSKLNRLAKHLHFNNLDDTFETTGKRFYKNALDENDLLGGKVKRIKFEEDVFKFRTNMNNLKHEQLGKFNQTLRTINRAVSVLADPNYAQKSLFKFIAKKTGWEKVVNKWNKKINIFKKRIFSKFFKKTTRTKKMILPLNHTEAPWILGLKLQPARANAIHYYHVTIIFNAALTNGKKPVILYNKPWKNIYKFLTAPSAGRYYINNISWGWDVGKMIRTNKLVGYELFNFASMFGQSIYLSTKTIMKTANWISDIVNHEWSEKWKNSYKNFLPNAEKAFFGKLPGGQFVNKLIRTTETGKSTYVTKYVKKKAKDQIYKYSKNEFKKITQGKNGVIGYGKYRYTVYKK